MPSAIPVSIVASTGRPSTRRSRRRSGSAWRAGVPRGRTRPARCGGARGRGCDASRCSRRSSIHFTGRPSRMREHGAATISSGKRLPLMPKPPPTSGAMTRTRFSAIPRRRPARCAPGAGSAVEVHRVSCPPPGRTRDAAAVLHGDPGLAMGRQVDLQHAVGLRKGGIRISPTKWRLTKKLSSQPAWRRGAPSRIASSTVAMHVAAARSRRRRARRRPRPGSGRRRGPRRRPRR